MSEPSIKYDQCDTCTCVDFTVDKENKGFCCGIVKQPNPKEDVLRFCLVGSEKADYIGLTIDEAFEIASLLAHVGSHYIKRRKTG